MRVEIRPNTCRRHLFFFDRFPLRRGLGADGDASYTVNPQPESGEQVTHTRSSLCRGGGGEGGVNTQLISSVADGEHHTASGDGGKGERAIWFYSAMAVR